jgi:Tfp pilus assembly protein PilF
MDLSSLVLVLALAATFIGVDTAWHPVSVVLDSAIPNKLDKLTADPAAIDEMLTYEVSAISSTPSVLAVPEIHVGANKGLGMAIAQAVSLQGVTLALQSRLGYQPEHIKLTLLSENGNILMMVNGSGLGGRISTPPFQKSVIMRPGETLASLVHRAALAGVAEIDPYFTSLYLVQSHAADQDFSEAEAMIHTAKAQLPPTPVSYDRSLLENLQGIISLFRTQPDAAKKWFHRAASSDPSNAVAVLNAGFADLQLGNYQSAIDHVQDLLANRPPTDRILLSTAYMTWGAALLGLADVDGADQKLAKAVEINPGSSTAYDLWSEAKHKKSDEAAAAQLHQSALASSGTFENYAEVAALYFELAWEQNQPITRNKFNNPPMERFN